MPLAKDGSEGSQCMVVVVVVAAVAGCWPLPEWEACVGDSWLAEMRKNVRESWGPTKKGPDKGSLTYDD